ncbi:MAG: hypothetical protein LBM59_04065 [Ruminococcus sp.]|nr:hypothetical protein [Ruminococcus sp.]
MSDYYMSAHDFMTIEERDMNIRWESQFSDDDDDVDEEVLVIEEFDPLEHKVTLLVKEKEGMTDEDLTF